MYIVHCHVENINSHAVNFSYIQLYLVAFFSTGSVLVTKLKADSYQLFNLNTNSRAIQKCRPTSAN